MVATSKGSRKRGESSHSESALHSLQSGSQLHKSNHQHPQANVAVGSIAHDFFTGKIKDKTTKESRKAAQDLAILRNKQRNPEWSPVNSKVAPFLLHFFRS